MPKGPNGQKRPADSIGCAVMVAEIAIGDIEDNSSPARGAAGGDARSKSLTPDKRKEIAKKAAEKRWG